MFNLIKNKNLKARERLKASLVNETFAFKWSTGIKIYSLNLQIFVAIHLMFNEFLHTERWPNMCVCGCSWAR